MNEKPQELPKLTTQEEVVAQETANSYGSDAEIHISTIGEEGDQKPVDDQAVDQVTGVNRNSIFEALKINPLRKAADSRLADTQETVSQSFYDVLVNNVNAAKEAGVDVSDIEAQMPELLKKVTRKAADSRLADTQ